MRSTVCTACVVSNKTFDSYMHYVLVLEDLVELYCSNILFLGPS